MATRILQTTFVTNQDAILAGIDTRQITAADKVRSLDSALARYSRDKPRVVAVDFAGTDAAYYVLYGLTTEILNSTRDASIDLTSSGADQQLAVSFTLPRRMQIHAVRFLLRRTGSLAGTLACEIRLPSGSLPSALAAQTSTALTSASALPLGFESGKTEFRFDTPLALDAGTYYAALVPSGYAYVNGTTEIVLGVDQSSVTNTVFTYGGAVWTAYGTDSAGVIEVVASLPDWDYEFSDIKGADIPAPTITENEIPQPLEDEDFALSRVGETQYLYLPNHSPASTDMVRLHYSARYLFNGSPLAADIPAAHFEAVCTLGVYFVCTWLAAKYSQNVDSGLSADIVDRRNQSDVMASRAKEFLSQYEALLGRGEGATIVPAMKFGD